MEKVKIFTKEMYNLAKVEFPWLNKNTYGLAEDKKEGSDDMLQVTRMLNRELKLRHNEGLREGFKEGLLKVAKNLLKKNVDISEIKELTGLSEDEIQKIK